jgi:hypothetical protein
LLMKANEMGITTAAELLRKIWLNCF